MLYLIGVGLGGIKDITLKGLDYVKSCEEVYLECYTSLFGDSIESISKFIDKSVKLADRSLIENHFDSIIDVSLTKDIALLVLGDPLSATTHCQILYDAKARGIPVTVVHNSSIISAVGCTGLQVRQKWNELYRFGQIVSIVHWTTDWQPESFYDKIVENYNQDLHTLCLLDIKIRELTFEGIIKYLIELIRNKEIYQQDYLQTAQEAAHILLKIAEKRGLQQTIGTGTSVVVCSRIGWNDQKIVTVLLGDLVTTPIEVIGDCPHSLIIPSKNLNPCESDFLSAFSIAL